MVQISSVFVFWKSEFYLFSLLSFFRDQLIIVNFFKPRNYVLK